MTGETSGMEGFEQRHVTEDGRVKEISTKLSMYENSMRTQTICQLTKTSESYISEPIRFEHYFFIKNQQLMKLSRNSGTIIQCFLHLENRAIFIISINVFIFILHVCSSTCM